VGCQAPKTCVGKFQPASSQYRIAGSDNRRERDTNKHPKETRMLRRTVIFFAITLGLPVLTAIAIAWAR